MRRKIAALLTIAVVLAAPVWFITRWLHTRWGALPGSLVTALGVAGAMFALYLLLALLDWLLPPKLPASIPRLQHISGPADRPGNQFLAQLNLWVYAFSLAICATAIALAKLRGGNASAAFWCATWALTLGVPAFTRLHTRSSAVGFYLGALTALIVTGAVIFWPSVSVPPLVPERLTEKITLAMASMPRRVDPSVLIKGPDEDQEKQRRYTPDLLEIEYRSGLRATLPWMRLPLKLKDGRPDPDDSASLRAIATALKQMDLSSVRLALEAVHPPGTAPAANTVTTAETVRQALVQEGVPPSLFHHVEDRGQEDIPQLRALLPGTADEIILILVRWY